MMDRIDHEGRIHMSERQQRSDEPTANAVARGLNILAVRNADVARRYMRHMRVPDQVIERVLDHPHLRRRESAAQSISEAITPSTPPGE
jgi:sulfatase maturation enzyme AslB (radical SAM superfamily)